MELYHFPLSPPSRSVRLLAKNIGVNLLLVGINILAGDQRKPEYMKISPFHTVPALNDSGFTLFESRSIMVYLLNKHDPNSTLYPKCMKARAVTDAMFQFDAGTLMPALSGIVRPILDRSEKPSAVAYEKLQDVFQCFNDLLSTRKFAAGNELTLSDYSIIHSLSSVEAFDLDISGYPNLVAYINRVKQSIPGYAEMNDEPVATFRAFVKSKTQGW